MGLAHGVGIGIPFGSSIGSSAQQLLNKLGDSYGMAIDFATDQSMVVNDNVTPTNNYSSSGIVNNVGSLVGPGGLLSYSSNSPSPKLCLQKNGLLAYGAHNLYLNSASPANQSITVNNGLTYSIIITGSVSITWSGAYVGTTTSGTTNFTAATGTLTGGSTTGSGTVQVVATPVVAGYVATAGTAIYALPYEWNTSGVCQGIKDESQKTNLVAYSNTFTNAAWTVVAATVTGSAATSPDGTNNATKLTCTSTQSNQFYMFDNLTVSTSTPYTWSVYCKQAEYSWVQLTLYDSTNANGNRFWFNLTTGVIGSTAVIGAGLSGATYGIQALPNGWYRCYCTSTTGSVTPFQSYLFLCNGDAVTTFSGTAGNGIYIYQADFIQSTYPTSPIVTGSAAANRAGDNIQIATSKFPYNQPTGTVYAKFNNCVALNTSGLAGRVFDLSDAVNNRVLDINGNGANSLLIFDGTTNFGSFSVNGGSPNKFAAAYQTSNYAGCINGGSVTTAADALVNTATVLYIGNYNNGSFQADGYIQQILYLPRRATNAQLQTITT